MFCPDRNALVCSHDHLTLFVTLVSGLEFIRFDLDLVRSASINILYPNGSSMFMTPPLVFCRLRTFPIWTWPPTCPSTTNPRTCWTLRNGCPVQTACPCIPSRLSPQPTWSGMTAPSLHPVKVGPSFSVPAFPGKKSR